MNNNNFDFGMNQYLGPPAGESYFPYNAPNFNFDINSYPNLTTEPLPPAPTDLFNLPQVYPPASHLSSGQGHMYPPSVSEFPSNGTYPPWMNSTSPAPIQMPSSVPQIAPQGIHDDNDQLVQQEFLDLLDEYHPPTDGFYNNLMYPNQDGSHMPDNMSLPSPYMGNECGEFSPPNSLMKPSMDDSCFPDYTPSESNPGSVDDENAAVAENEDLSEINIRDLNKALRDQGYSQEEQMEVKQIRRKQKNRVYAKNCRKNKEEKKTTMKSQKEMLETEINDLKSDVERLRAQRNQYKMSYDMMQQRKQQNT